MASATRKMGALALGTTVFGPVAVGTAGYAAWRINWQSVIKSFFTGPGRTSRIALLLFIILNAKSIPFAWTYRVFSTLFYHSILRKSPKHTPQALFKPIISRSYAPLLEIDYNLHKSNSTYFADLDVSRSHLTSYLLRSGLHDLANNATSKLVLDPKTGKPVRGPMVVALGATQCSFKREISAYKSYEMWSCVLAWDRKWYYIATYFLPKGAAVPTEWLDPRFRKTKTRSSRDAAGGWERKIYATAVSKYVFKIGRLTVHPAVVLGASGLLPERPGGWTSGENQLGDDSVDLSDVDIKSGEWDWRRVEAQRRKGMELAAQFHALDGLHETFEGGSNGALAKF